jgi:acyl-CoA thioester hydrolase
MEDFSVEKRIYYHDTDCGGVVYYANYLKYLEEARTEYYARRGVSLKELMDRDVWFAVARVEIEYKSPAHYQDMLRIITRVGKIKGSVIQFFQEVIRGHTIVAEAKTMLMCVNSEFKPIPLPDEVKGPLMDRV